MMEVSVLKCEFCSHKFSSKPEWKMHMKAEHGMTVYVCDLCPKVYYGESEYIQHFDAEHKSEFNRHTCSFCGVSYKWFKFLEKHIQKKHQVNNLKQCNKCGEEFYNTMAYQRHLKLKHAPGRVFYKCKKCFRSFTAKSYVVLHEKFDHNPKGLKYFREYASENLNLETQDLLDDLKKCSKCNLKYSSALYLYRHFKLVHNKKKFYQCCKCQDAVYGTRTGLTIHLFHEHNVSREHKCGKCTTALLKRPSNKKIKKEVVKPVPDKNRSQATEDGPPWSKLFIKQGIPKDVELNDADEVEITNLRNNIRSLFHILSTVPPSKLKGTTHSDLHVESVFSIHKLKCNDDRRTYEIEAIDTEEDDNDNNERFLSNADENENKQLKRKMRELPKKDKNKIHGVLTVVKNKDGNERYQCDICHHEFSYRKGLKAHIISRHGFNGKFRKADTDRVEIETSDSSYINSNVFERACDMVSMLVERMNDSNDWAEMKLSDKESEYKQTQQDETEQTDETDPSQKENKCDASQKDNDSDTSAIVNKSNTAQKIAKSETIPKNTKSEDITSTVNKSNTLHKDNKFTSLDESNSPNKVKKSDTAPKHKSNIPQKNLIFGTPQHVKCDATQKVNKSNTNKSKCPKAGNSEKTASDKKYNTPQKDITCDTPQKVEKCDTTQKEHKSETSNKVNNSNTPQKESKNASPVNSGKTAGDKKYNKPQKDITSDTPQKVEKCDANQKENKSETSNKVNNSNTPQKESKTASTVNSEKTASYKKHNKPQKDITSDTPQKVQKSDATQKENKSETSTKAHNSNTSQKESKTASTVNSEKTAGDKKYNKTQKDITSDTPQKVEKFDATQRENKSETSTKVNNSNTPQNESGTASTVKSSENTKKSKFNTIQRDASFGPPPKVKKCNATQKIYKLETTPKLSISTEIRQLKENIQKDTKSDISQKDIDVTRKDKKSETSTNLNECESTQKLNKSNTPQNEKTNTGPKFINSETTTLDKSNTIPKETNFGSQTDVKKKCAMEKVNQSTETSKPKATSQKNTKSDKYTEPGTPKKGLNSDTTQKETKSNTLTKANKSVTTKKMCESNTPQKENKSAVCTKVNNSETAPKPKSNTSQEDSNPTAKKVKKSHATQRKLFCADALPKINISTSEPTTPDTPENVNQPASTQNVNTTNYKCNFCQIEFEDQLLLLNHLTESHSDSEPKDGETIYKCVECGIAFQQENSLNAHVEEQHTVEHTVENTSLDIVPNTCEICNKTFNDKRGLKLHSLRTHNVKNVYSCKKCNFKHSNKRKLRNHPCLDNQIDIEVENNEEKTVQGKENSILKEDEYEEIKNKLLKMCKKEINSKKARQDDQKRIHKCLKCESKFPKRTSLLNHIKNEHKINLFKLYKCEKCNSVFKMADKLKQHIKMKHKTVQERSNLPVIKISKSKMSPIKLSNGKMPNILSNIFYLNGKMHTCRVCNSYFPSSELLQRHVEWEHTKNVNLHKCGQCSQVLYNVEDLEMHMSNAHNNTDGIFKWKKQIAFNYEQQTDL